MISIDKLAEQVFDMLERLRLVLSGPLGPEIVDRMNAALADTRLRIVPRVPTGQDDVFDDDERVEAIKRWLHTLRPELQDELARRIAVANMLTDMADAALIERRRDSLPVVQ